MERRDRKGPDNALVVVMLFDGRGCRAPDPDAVASHHGQAFLAVGIEE